jgi:(p)ppGpp synthase/HD superfamily hydrolase
MENIYTFEEKNDALMHEAIIFAFNSHSGQYRIMNSEQYIIHPLRVNEFLLKNFGHHPSIEKMRIAAILHDTVEDTWVNLEDIEKKFGAEIKEIVSELSKPNISDIEEKNKLYLDCLCNAKDESKIIKLADIFDNVVISTDDNPKWKNLFLKSKNILETMTLKNPDSKYEHIKTELLKIINKKLELCEKTQV